MDLSTIYNLVSDATRNLANELEFLSEVDQKVRLVNVKLQNMEKFLKNFEKKHKDHDHVKVLVNQIRDAAYEAEDIVDEFVINVARENRKTMTEKVLGIFHKGTKLHDFGNRIDDLNAVIQKICQDKDNFANEQGESSIDRDDAESRRISCEKKLQEMRQKVEEDGVVGFVEEANTLAKQLIEGTDDLKVISISGMGGLGKTTLARKVYKDRFVTDRFRCRAWVSVSQKFNAKQFLQRIVEEITQMGADETENMSEYQLKEELSKQLSYVRYLIVLDDIWEIDHWYRIVKMLPKNQNGSRIFITTREAEIAHHAGDKDPIPLRFLDDNESRQLFTKKVFGGRSCPKDLISPTNQILKICGGLPLAIVVSAGILGRKPETPDVWEDTAATISVRLENDATCKYTLGLSYEVLPSYLKPCFLYFGLFPEDYQISAKQLIQLWIAEGFIRDEDTGTHTKERVARTYLQELIDRSLVQVEERSSNGGVKKCRVHDLTRDLCLGLSRPDRFLECHANFPREQNKPRRLSVHCSRQNYMLAAAATNSSNTHQVRTLLCFKEDNKKFAEEHWNALFSSFKLLRVLDLGEGDVHSIPGEIEELVLLKYLKIKTNKVAAVPPSIYTLFNLQTLDLRRTRISNLPEGIWKMQQLRHLYLDGPSGLPKKKDEGRFLSKLQTLSYILQDRTGQVKISEMAPNLRKLGLFNYQSCSGEEDSVFKLPYLETLKFASNCIFNEQFELPESIKKISIKASNLPPKAMEVFQNLSTLQILKLDEVTFSDDVLVFEEDSFQGLQVFIIENSTLNNWILEAGAAPNLKRVVISKCPGLKRISEQLWELPELQKLELLWLRENFTKEIVKTKNDKVDVMIYPNILESRV